MEMQGRIGELGREMAKFATSPGMLSTMPSRVQAQAVSTAPQTNSSIAGLTAPSPPPPASAPAGLPPARTGFTLPAPLEQPTRARSSSISPTPRKRYTVALGEPIMKPRVSASPPPISVGEDDNDDNDGTNDAEEEDSVDRTIGRSVGRHASAQYKKGQRSNGVGLGFGFGLRMGNGNGEDTDTSVDSAPRSARPPRPRVHPRTTSRSPSSAQSMASSTANARGSRMNTQRLLGHGRALSINRAAAGGASPRTPKPRSSTTTTTPTTPASASATMGFRDPLVMRREENEARAKAVPPPPKVVTGRPRAPVGELVAYFDKS